MFYLHDKRISDNNTYNKSGVGWYEMDIPRSISFNRINIMEMTRPIGFMKLHVGLRFLVIDDNRYILLLSIYTTKTLVI